LVVNVKGKHMDHDKRLVWTVEEVAERLGIGLSTAYEVVNAGTIRARQINRKWLIPKAALSEYLDGRDNPARVMSMDEVAEALGVHRDTVSKMLGAGTIRAIRAGRTWKIPLFALEEFLAGRDNPPMEEQPQPE
jgi:excisionase family DNA binding protein